MVMDDPSGDGWEAPQHHGPRYRENERRLRALGASIPKDRAAPRSIFDHEPVRRIGRYAIVAVVVVLVVGGGARWFESIPTPTFHSSLPASIHLSGTLPSLPWPTTGSAALSVDGAGSLGASVGSRPVPIAGLATVMTAYVILKDHPLASGSNGPTIPVAAATIAAANAEAATQQSFVPVSAGETFTELEALEGLLVAQGNDMGTLLSDWDAGSSTAFVAKMNLVARHLGLDATTFTDPTGLESTTVSTPADMILLGQAAMDIPVLAEIVAMPQVTLPIAGVVYNYDYDVGHDGIVGIKTGEDAAAGGCFLFAAQQTEGGRTITLVGAVLGQQGYSPLTTALDEAETLVNAAFTTTKTYSDPLQGRAAGSVVAAWGSVAVTVTSSPQTFIGWPGLEVPVTTHVGVLRSSLPDHDRIGLLSIGLGHPAFDVALRTLSPLLGPSALWRLVRW